MEHFILLSSRPMSEIDKRTLFYTQVTIQLIKDVFDNDVFIAKYLGTKADKNVFFEIRESIKNIYDNKNPKDLVTVLIETPKKSIANSLKLKLASSLVSNENSLIQFAKKLDESKSVLPIIDTITKIDTPLEIGMEK